MNNTVKKPWFRAAIIILLIVVLYFLLDLILSKWVYYTESSLIMTSCSAQNTNQGASPTPASVMAKIGPVFTNAKGDKLSLGTDSSETAK